MVDLAIVESLGPPRLRAIRTPEEVGSQGIDAADLRRCAIAISAAAAGDGDTLEIFDRLFPWMEIWRAHRSYVDGVWRCAVDASVVRPEYTAYQERRLEFHTDMSRYQRPPEFTAIRCIKRASTGGANLVLHIDDVFGRLRDHGREDIIAMLIAQRTLNMERRHVDLGSGSEVPERSVSIAVPEDPTAPSRVFDHYSATKGKHLEMSPRDEALYSEFLEFCGRLQDVTGQVVLGPYDVLAFSNWRFLHARTECSSGRITEISMGDERVGLRSDFS